MSACLHCFSWSSVRDTFFPSKASWNPSFSAAMLMALKWLSYTAILPLYSSSHRVSMVPCFFSGTCSVS